MVAVATPATGHRAMRPACSFDFAHRVACARRRSARSGVCVKSCVDPQAQAIVRPAHHSKLNLTHRSNVRPGRLAAHGRARRGGRGRPTSGQRRHCQPSDEAEPVQLRTAHPHRGPDGSCRSLDDGVARLLVLLDIEGYELDVARGSGRAVAARAHGDRAARTFVRDSPDRRQQLGWTTGACDTRLYAGQANSHAGDALPEHDVCPCTPAAGAVDLARNLPATLRR